MTNSLFDDSNLLEAVGQNEMPSHKRWCGRQAVYRGCLLECPMGSRRIDNVDDSANQLGGDSLSHLLQFIRLSHWYFSPYATCAEYLPARVSSI